MANRAAGRNCLCRRDDSVGVDAIVPIELGERARLAEMLDAQRARSVSGNSAEPGESHWVAIKHGDNAAMRRHVGEQPLDM
jgi:hypothetical protein